jgi:hypothetical protein
MRLEDHNGWARPTRSARVTLGATILAVAFSLAAQSTATAGPGGKGSSDSRRAYYLTQTLQDAAAAPYACAPGFHMASLSEIFDPTNLRYDTSLGVFTDEPAAGIPPVRFGWIRVGIIVPEPYQNDTPGRASCNHYTSSDPDLNGTVVAFDDDWAQWSTPNRISPWQATIRACSVSQRTWCVQD